MGKLNAAVVVLAVMMAMVVCGCSASGLGTTQPSAAVGCGGDFTINGIAWHVEVSESTCSQSIASGILTAQITKDGHSLFVRAPLSGASTHIETSGSDGFSWTDGNYHRAVIDWISAPPAWELSFNDDGYPLGGVLSGRQN